MTKPKEKSAAIVTIYDAARMSRKGRKQVAEWIRCQAQFLEDCPGELAPQYRARYIYGGTRG